jgi:1,2-diacylglycerol 3-alpha-glucosyltransferase
MLSVKQLPETALPERDSALRPQGEHATLRVLILSEIISPYRIPVFNALAVHDGIDLHVVFLAETDPGLRHWRVYKDEIRFSYEILRSRRLHIGQGNFLLNWGLKPALRDFSPHTLICGGYNYPASWQALVWSYRHGCQFILWSESNSHDARARRPWIEFLKSRFLEHCDGFVVPGRASREYLESLGQGHKNIFTAPNAVDNDWFGNSASRLPTNEIEFRKKFELPSRYVLFVGRMIPEKGVFDLLEAYGKLGPDLRSNVGLVFAGEGVSRKELERQSRELAPGTVRFPGFLQREELAPLYALADVLILPTHSDPWGLVVNEAMASGLPIIVSSAAGCSADLVLDGRNGFVVPPRNSERLSLAIETLLQNPQLRQEMSRESTARIRAHSPEACAHGLAGAVISGGRQVQ